MFIIELIGDEEKKENKKATNMTRWQIEFMDLLYFILSTITTTTTTKKKPIS